MRQSYQNNYWYGNLISMWFIWGNMGVGGNFCVVNYERVKV